MADPDAPITEQVLEPSPLNESPGAPEHYPFLFSFQGEDVLEMTTWNSAAGVRVTMQGRIHTGPGKTVPFTHTHTSNTDRSIRTTVLSMPRGELLNCIAYVSAGAPVLGQTFVRVAVRRGADAAFERLGVIIQRPITTTIAAAFPGSAVISPIETDPAPRSIQGTTPGVGADVLETVPTGARWRLHSLAFDTGTAVGPAKQDITFEDAAGNVIGGTVSPFNHPGTSTIKMIFTAGLPTPYSNTAPGGLKMFGGLPFPMILQAAQRFRVINSGTFYTFTNVFYTVGEYLDI